MLEFWLKGPKHRIYFLTEGSHKTPGDLAARIKATGPEAAALTGVVRLVGRKPSPESWKKIMAVIRRALDIGVEKTAINKKRCKCFHVSDDSPCHDGSIEVCEFKADELRMMFFREESVQDEPCTTLIITHCFIKKQDATPAEEITRFCRLRCAYYSWRKKSGATDAVHAYELAKRKYR